MVEVFEAEAFKAEVFEEEAFEEGVPEEGGVPEAEMFEMEVENDISLSEISTAYAAARLSVTGTGQSTPPLLPLSSPSTVTPTPAVVSSTSSPPSISTREKRHQTRRAPPAERCAAASESPLPSTLKLKPPRTW